MSDTTPEKPVDPTSADPTEVDPTLVDPTFVEPVTSEVAVSHEEVPAVLSEPVHAESSESTQSSESSEPAELVEPAAESSAADPGVLHDALANESTDEPTVVPTVAETTAAETAAEPEPIVTRVAPPQTVYVHAPVPPQKKGNRGIGSLIALLSAVIFAAIYAGVVLAVVPWFAPPRAVGFEFLTFISSAAFYIPVLVFALGFILLVLILNRAGWWSYILGSLFVGVFVYFVSIGVLLLVNGVIGFTPSEAFKAFLSALQSPVTIVAGLVAREVTLWMGAAISARGRKVKVRNAEAREAYDRDTARAKADYERAVAANAAH
ncbi:MAG: hypothetical protein ABI400_08935 [Lacisediminihabitans sp.]